MKYDDILIRKTASIISGADWNSGGLLSLIDPFKFATCPTQISTTRFYLFREFVLSRQDYCHFLKILLNLLTGPER